MKITRIQLNQALLKLPSPKYVYNQSVQPICEVAFTNPLLIIHPDNEYMSSKPIDVKTLIFKFDFNIGDWVLDIKQL